MKKLLALGTAIIFALAPMPSQAYDDDNDTARGISVWGTFENGKIIWHAEQGSNVTMTAIVSQSSEPKFMTAKFNAPGKYIRRTRSVSCKASGTVTFQLVTKWSNGTYRTDVGFVHLNPTC